VIVRLTNRQRQRVFDLASTHLADDRRLEAFGAWYDADVSTASKHRVDTVMPAAAWRMVEDIMFSHCFNERGFRARDRVKTTDLNALKAIRRALNARECHPALFQRGAIGYINELVPAWRFPGPDASGKCYSPYPVPGMNFVVLAPETRVVELRTSTLWTEAQRLPERLLLTESQHWAFT
jgi:hypothetical protein